MLRINFPLALSLFGVLLQQASVFLLLALGAKELAPDTYASIVVIQGFSYAIPAMLFMRLESRLGLSQSLSEWYDVTQIGKKIGLLLFISGLFVGLLLKSPEILIYSAVVLAGFNYFSSFFFSSRGSQNLATLFRVFRPSLKILTLISCIFLDELHGIEILWCFAVIEVFFETIFFIVSSKILSNLIPEAGSYIGFVETIRKNREHILFQGLNTIFNKLKMPMMTMLLSVAVTPLVFQEKYIFLKLMYASSSIIGFATQPFLMKYISRLDCFSVEVVRNVLRHFFPLHIFALIGYIILCFLLGLYGFSAADGQYALGFGSLFMAMTASMGFFPIKFNYSVCYDFLQVILIVFAAFSFGFDLAMQVAVVTVGLGFLFFYRINKQLISRIDLVDS